MSVLIKGMKMPKGCLFCKIKKRNGKKMICPFCDEEWDIRDPMSADHRLENCPLIEISPHGRLIDADELQKDFNALLPFKENNDITEDYVDGIMVGCDTLQNAPTIIQAEEGE